MSKMNRNKEAVKGSRVETSINSPVRIGDREVPNRIVHQAMECNDSFNGFPSELTLKRYRRLAEAKAGITVVESVATLNSSLSRLHELIGDEEHRAGIEKLTSEFKKINQDTILCYQLTYSAGLSDPRFSEVVRVYDTKDPGTEAGRILETSEIRQIREAFIKTAEIVHDSGADMVDVKLCHGYFGSQIIRPANIRNDEYGGNLVNRMRFAREVIEGIKDRIPDSNFKIMSRLSIYEKSTTAGNPLIGGIGTKGPEGTEFNFDEPREMLRMLVDYGVDVVNITGGDIIPRKIPNEFVVDNPQSYSAYHLIDFARRAKELNLGVPVIASGFSVFGKDLATVGENCILHGYADMVGIGRQTMADPDTERILAGSANYCVRCMGCIELLGAQMPVGCVQYDTVYALIRKSSRLHNPAT